MRRRSALRKIGTATTLAFGAFAGTAAAADSDDVSTDAFCEHHCFPVCCSDCPDACENCENGCLCADPTC